MTEEVQNLLERVSDYNETVIATLRAINCTETNAVASVLEGNRINIGRLEEGR